MKLTSAFVAAALTVSSFVDAVPLPAGRTAALLERNSESDTPLSVQDVSSPSIEARSLVSQAKNLKGADKFRNIEAFEGKDPKALYTLMINALPKTEGLASIEHAGAKASKLTPETIEHKDPTALQRLVEYVRSIFQPRAPTPKQEVKAAGVEDPKSPAKKEGSEKEPDTASKSIERWAEFHGNLDKLRLIDTA